MEIKHQKFQESKCKFIYIFIIIYCYLHLLFLKIFSVVDLNKNGYVKTVCFSDNSNDEIKKTIENLWPLLKNRDWKFFRCTSTSKLGIAETPNVGWNIEALKR